MKDVLVNVNVMRAKTMHETCECICHLSPFNEDVEKCNKCNCIGEIKDA